MNNLTFQISHVTLKLPTQHTMVPESSGNQLGNCLVHVVGGGEVMLPGSQILKKIHTRFQIIGLQHHILCLRKGG